MAMDFETVQTALTTLLGNNAAGQFKVIGYQRQGESADEVKDNNKLVQVFYKRGEFPKSGSGFNGPVKHNAVYQIYFTVSKAAKVDIATLNDDTKTPAQKQTALANLAESAALADVELNTFFRLVYQILMAANNQDVGLAVGKVASRWIGELEKDDPLERGDLLVLTGACTYTCTLSENLTGAAVTTATEGTHTTVQINDQAGVPDPNVNTQVTV